MPLEGLVARKKVSMYTNLPKVRDACVRVRSTFTSRGPPRIFELILDSPELFRQPRPKNQLFTERISTYMVTELVGGQFLSNIYDTLNEITSRCLTGMEDEVSRVLHDTIIPKRPTTFFPYRLVRSAVVPAFLGWVIDRYFLPLKLSVGDTFTFDVVEDTGSNLDSNVSSTEVLTCACISEHIYHPWFPRY